MSSSTRDPAMPAMIGHWPIRFEQEFWVGAPQQRRNGTLHTDVFLGYCAEVGAVGYELMIPDNYSLLTDETGMTSSA